VKSAYLDSELCALNGDGVPVFSRLQAAMDEGRTDQLIFFAFDLLFLNGVSTAQLPLIKRKERLQRLFKKKSSGLRYSDNVGPRFSTKPAGSVSKAPSRRRPIVLTSPATAGEGSRSHAGWSVALRARPL
jgi:hypothetical protein